MLALSHIPHADGEDVYRSAFCDGLRPDPPLWVEDWADRHMVIPAESGAAEPGRYRVGRTPYARDVMHALSPEHPARKVIVKGASQLLKTQVALNWISAVIDRQPANIIVLEPTDKLARRVAARFDKVCQAVDVLRAKVAVRKDRDAKNTADTKEFKGGTAWFLSARSASNLAEASARYLVVDEVDRLLRELKGEGDPIGLAEKRQTTYGRKAKGLYISSPTEEESSRIDELYREGNQQKYHVPCPHCGQLQTLEWERVVYDLPANSAVMACENGCIIEEHHKPLMLPDVAAGGRAEWRPTSRGNGEVWSYEISSIYAPLGWVSWLDLAREHAEAQKALDAGDAEKMQVFYNTRLARTWAVNKTRVQPEVLQAKAEPYPIGIAPAGVRVVTASVDVQGNRLEFQLVGWGPGSTGLEAWVINTAVFFGDPTLPEVWRQLDEALKMPVPHAWGASMIIRAVLIDSGDGDSTQEVYEFVRRRKSRFIGGQRQDVLAIKGASAHKKPVINRPSKIDFSYRGKPIANGAEVWLIGTDTAKDWIYNRLALTEQVAIHTCTALPLEFYQQLMSETKVTKYRNGRKYGVYEPLKRNTRNEQLDLLVYNLAGAHFLALDRHTESHWRRYEQALREVDLFAPSADEPAAAEIGHEPENPEPAVTPAAKKPPQPIRRARNFATRF